MIEGRLAQSGVRPKARDFALWSDFAHALQAAELSADNAATLVCLLAALLLEPQLCQPRVAQWLLHQADPAWRDLLGLALKLCRQQPYHESGSADADEFLGSKLSVQPAAIVAIWQQFRSAIAVWVKAHRRDEDPFLLTHFAEIFLARHDGQRRAALGVYYTPDYLVRHMILRVDHYLRSEFGLSQGLADCRSWFEVMTGSARGTRDSETRHVCANSSWQRFADLPFVHILDPAAGSGAFLVEIIRMVHRELTREDRPLLADEAWNACVASILPRLSGWETQLAGCAMAQLHIAACLDATGFRFDVPLPLNVQLRDALGSPPAEIDGHLPFTIIVGNPPFSGVSQNNSAWIQALLRGQAADDPSAASYFRVGDRPLGERKVWINDDYVKFYRLGQWLIERAGVGVLAYVSNHGFLDSVSFRGMRGALCQAFPRISIIDLHGNRKRHERLPGGQPDYNVFSIAQGTALGYFRRPPAAAGQSATRPLFDHFDLRGTESQKRAWLNDNAKCQELDTCNAGMPAEAWRRRPFPKAPLFLLNGKDSTLSHRRRGPDTVALTEVMPLHITAPVTARDSLVTALHEDELVARLQHFADTSMSDEQIREHYFPRPRSQRYPAGDTRGWKLAAARQRLAAVVDLRPHIITCLYRPFDWRAVFWTDWMIDWPRPALQRCLELTGNWCLITRRQMLPQRDCNFFWATSCMALDGVIRSDSRGSESLFPVYVCGSDDGGPENAAPNFAARFISRLTRRVKLRWQPRGRGDLASGFGPEDVAHYLYGLFHCPAYRMKYAEHMASDFPPVLLPRSAESFRQVVDVGRTLVRLHLRRRAVDRAGQTAGSPIEVARGYPRWKDGDVWIARDTVLQHGVPAAVWQFHVGAHQVCRKWLRDRQGVPLSPADAVHYALLVRAVRRTLQLQARLAAIGFEQLFA